MRLINIETMTLVDFPGRPPPYAILSHRWEEEEVTYRDFQDEKIRETQQGFKKIRYTCEQAKRDVLGYAWVDTCCIDKSSSAELSEAINSMFKWYREATFCYAYLSDVLLPTQQCTPAESDREWRLTFRASKWFTRGWTLQELIAPQELVFYDRHWSEIGKKIDLTGDISEITGISAGVLGGVESLTSKSLAMRMSWASKRETTREEDIAYCLMGIFDVNMPMLYGEGAKAFIRLQEEILKETEDHSLFAWRASPESALAAPYRGILAASPAEFINCNHIAPYRDYSLSPDVSAGITARGVPLKCMVGHISHNEVAHMTPRRLLGILNCGLGDDFRHSPAIEVVQLGGSQFLRCNPSQLFKVSHGPHDTAPVFMTKTLHTSKLDRPPFLERQFGFYFSLLSEGVEVIDVYPRNINYDPQLRVLELGPWIQDNACVDLKLPGWMSSRKRLRLFLWAFRPRRQGPMADYQAAFLPRISEAEPRNNPTANVKKPGECVNEKNAVTQSIKVGFGSRATVVVEIRQRKVQGLDMFCISIMTTKTVFGLIWHIRPQNETTLC